MFCFYYKENMELLEKMGCRLIPFSPLSDPELPEGLDGLILGGGYPELYACLLYTSMPLAENREEIHILPASYGIEESLHLPGTKILMKAGRKMPEVKQILCLLYTSRCV